MTTQISAVLASEHTRTLIIRSGIGTYTLTVGELGITIVREALGERGLVGSAISDAGSVKLRVDIRKWAFEDPISVYREICNVIDTACDGNVHGFTDTQTSALSHLCAAIITRMSETS